jgi:hypothetical protein
MGLTYHRINITIIGTGEIAKLKSSFIRENNELEKVFPGFDGHHDPPTLSGKPFQNSYEI